MSEIIFNIELIETSSGKWYGKSLLFPHETTILYDSKEILQDAIVNHELEWEFDIWILKSKSPHLQLKER